MTTVDELILAEKLSTRPLAVRRVTPHGDQGVTVEVVREEPLALEINGREVAILMRLPGQEKELAVGFCLSEGLLSDFRAIYLVHHCGQGAPDPLALGGEEDRGGTLSSRNRVQIRAEAAAVQHNGGLSAVRLIRSGCGAVDVAEIKDELPTINSELTVRADVLLKLNALMRQHQTTYRLSGGVHAVALFEADGRLVTLQEDIGRHNAVDKALGYCLLRDIPLSDKVLLSTGRASYELVSKAARLGVPIVASVSAATSLAVQLAQESRCTLIGYLRGKRMNVYAHPWRIIGSERGGNSV